MADIRINALATTATTPASDDYLALDGTAQGTRKILATNIANNVTDVILGSSGPSVKSTLSARAPRQGLVFDGTAGATVGTFSNWGTADFSICAWINPSLSANAYILTPTSGSDMYFTVNSNGTLRVSSGGFTQDLTSTGTVSANKWALVSYVRSGTTATFYINGIAAGSGTDSFNWGRVTGVGSSGYVGTIAPVYPYNRALSASEVVALYEAGAPAGADYNSASNTSIVTSAFVNGNSGGSYLYDTYSGASATGFTAVKTQTTTEADAYSGNTFSVVKGQQFLVTFTCTLTSGTLPELYLSDWTGSPLYNSASPITAGSFSRVITATQSGSGVRLRFYNPPANQVNYSISNLSITRLGLLLAPDAAQAGGGLVWYDTSGNAANITIPASGVSWNVPTSGYVTSGSSLNLSAGGTNQNITLTPSGTGDVRLIGGTNSTLRFFNGATQKGALFFSTTDGALEYNDTLATSVKIFTGAAANSFIVSANGNTMLGTSGVDGGQKLQVSGTARVSGVTTVGGGSNDLLKLEADTAGNGGYLMGRNAADTDYTPLILIGNGLTLKYRTGVNSSANALAIDSSANATFAGQALSSVNAANATNFGNFVASNATLNAFVSYTSGASLDQKYWVWQSGSAVGDGVFRLRAINDGNTNGKNAIVVKRTGISSVIVNLPSLPTSSAGLAAGDLWNDSGTVKVV